MTPTPRTAVALLAALERAGCSPLVTERGLTLPRRPPADLFPLVRLLQTGVRSILTRLPWWGLSSDTGWSVELNAAGPIPVWVDLLAVGGDKAWDRIRFHTLGDFPELFVSEPEPKNWGARTAWQKRRAAA